jgi:hypothetical protein
MANGNNLVFKGDVTRRVVICRLDPRHDNPAKRTFFTFDAATLARECRPQLVVDGLTMFRAYIAAGRPLAGKVDKLGSFEEWTLVRELLIWLGQPDPVATQEHVLQDDPDKQAFIEMLEAWAGVFGNKTLRTGAAINEVIKHQDLENYERLHQAMLAACPDKLNGRTLGHWFKRNEGRSYGGRRFVRKQDLNHGAEITLKGAGPTQNELPGLNGAGPSAGANCAGRPGTGLAGRAEVGRATQLEPEGWVQK